MAIGITKPGQGYWVRVITAAMLGVLVLALAAWVWSQAKLVADRLPKTTWTANVGQVTGTPTVGSNVELVTAPARAGQPGAVIGTAKLDSYDAERDFLHLTEVNAQTGKDPSQAASLKPVGSDTFNIAMSGRAQAISTIEPLYLQGAGAAIVILIGAVLIYWLIAVKPSSVDFLIATDAEVKKVNWSTRKDIIGSTYVVIGAALLLALSLFVIDVFFKTVFQAIGILAK